MITKTRQFCATRLAQIVELLVNSLTSNIGATLNITLTLAVTTFVPSDPTLYSYMY